MIGFLKTMMTGLAVVLACSVFAIAIGILALLGYTIATRYDALTLILVIGVVWLLGMAFKDKLSWLWE